MIIRPDKAQPRTEPSSTKGKPPMYILGSHSTVIPSIRQRFTYQPSWIVMAGEIEKGRDNMWVGMR